MSDTLAQGTAALAQGYQADPLTAAVQAAPELAQSPSSAMAVAQTGGGAPVAQSVAAHQSNMATADAAQKADVSHGGGLLDDIGSFFGHTIVHTAEDLGGGVLKLANAPLNFVQHEYKYLHDVEATHGWEAAVMEGMAITAGAAGGFLVAGGPGGAALGAEAATALLGQVAYHSSWQRTASANYRDPHTGQLVSFGRDIASLVGLHPGEGDFSDLSGALDAVGDLLADPTSLVGGVAGEAISPAGAGGLLSRRLGGTSLATAEDVERAYGQYGSVKRAFTDIAGMDAGRVAAKYPAFAAIAPRLGAASTADDVADVFRDTARAGEIITTDRLPTLSISRIPIRKVIDAAQNADGRIANNFLVGPRRWADRLTRLPGGTFDPKSMDFNSREIDPTNLYGLQNLRSLLRYSETERVAEDVMSSYANADVATRVGIIRNSIINVLFGMAHQAVPEDAEDLGDYLNELADGEVKSKISERLKELTAYGSPDGVYMNDAKGRAVPGIIDGDRTYQAGLTLNQVGKIALPDFNEAKRMAAMIRGGRNWLGRLDDFLYDHVTQGFFKPLVLQSIGYAFHISGAEIVPNAWRVGVGTLARSTFVSVAEKMGWRVEQGDANAFETFLYRSFGRIPNQKEIEESARIFPFTGGNGVTNGISAGENYGNEVAPTERAAQALRSARGKLPMKTGDDFGLFGPDEKRFNQMWQNNLREVAQDGPGRVAARGLHGIDQSNPRAMEQARRTLADHLRNLPETTRDSMIRSKKFSMEHPPPGWDPHDDWALRLQQGVQGLTTGRNGLIHTDFLDRIAKGDVPKASELDKLDAVDKPAMLKGRPLVPDGSSSIQRIAAFGFRKVLNPMVNTLSREPLFRVEFRRAYSPLEKMVQDGVMTEDQAVTVAMARATNHMVRFVHNIHDRSQWTDTLRNFAPFFFAQEQAYKRAGRLLVENPGAFRRYQLMISAVHDIANKQEDGQGNQYIVFPGSGWLGRNVPYAFNLLGMPVGSAVPAAFGGSFTAANMIFPLSQGFRPDVGPVMAIPAQALAEFFPELGKKYASFAPVANVVTSALTTVVGSDEMSQPIWEQLVPNTFVQRVIETAQASDASFNSSMIQTMQALDYEQNQAMATWIKGGKKGPPPSIIPAPGASAQDRQNFVNMVRNQTRIRYAMRALIGLVSPVSADVQIDNWGLPNELSNDIDKANSVSTGIENFLAKNPEATPYTVFESMSTTPGAPAPADSTQAETWINDNMPLINKYPAGAMWLMPQLTNSTYSPTVYNEQIAQDLRVKQTPADFLTSLYVAAGNQVYYPALTIHEAALQAAGNNYQAKNAEYSSWNQYVESLQQQNPLWANSYFSADKQTYRQQAISQLKTIFTEGLAPQNSQTDAVASLLEQYDEASSAYATASSSSNYSTAETQVRDLWESNMIALAKQSPALRPIIDSVFKDALVVDT